MARDCDPLGTNCGLLVMSRRMTVVPPPLFGLKLRKRGFGQKLLTIFPTGDDLVPHRYWSRCLRGSGANSTTRAPRSWTKPDGERASRVLLRISPAAYPNTRLAARLNRTICCFRSTAMIASSRRSRIFTKVSVEAGAATTLLNPSDAGYCERSLAVAFPLPT